MSDRASVFARKGYSAGRRAERYATAEWLSGLADAVADLVALSYLDGRRDAGDVLDNLDEERIAHVHELRGQAAWAYRRLGYSLQRRQAFDD